MSQYNVPPSLAGILKDMKTRIKRLEISQSIGVFTTATRPSSDNVSPGVIIFVSDASSGSKFQGWDGSEWVSLG